MECWEISGTLAYENNLDIFVAYQIFIGTLIGKTRLANVCFLQSSHYDHLFECLVTQQQADSSEICSQAPIMQRAVSVLCFC